MGACRGSAPDRTGGLHGGGFPPYPYPSRTRVLALQAILEPVAFPKCPETGRLRRVSGPRFRAYLAAQSVAWRPGRTRVPHPGNRRFRVWTGDASKYPVLTAADRDRLAFGEGWEDRQRKEGRRNADAHWEELPGSVILTHKASTQDGRAGWLIVPEAAADAIRKRERGNRGK